MQTEKKLLTNNFGEIHKLLHQRSYHRFEKELIYPGQPKLLALIKANEGIPQKELSKKNCVKPSTITGMLNKLEANHYVYRVSDVADKRIMRVYLTEEGHQFADQSEQFIQKITDQMYEGFTQEELETLILLTNKMKHNLSKETH